MSERKKIDKVIDQLVERDSPAGRPKPKMRGDIDGNAYSILGHVAKALRKAGYSKEEIKQYQDAATSGDYNNLLNVSGQWVDFVFPDDEDDDDEYEDGGETYHRNLEKEAGEAYDEGYDDAINERPYQDTSDWEDRCAREYADGYAEGEAERANEYGPDEIGKVPPGSVSSPEP